MAETVLFQEVDPQALFGGEFPTLGLGIVPFDDKKEASASGRLAARNAVTSILPVAHIPEEIMILKRESGRPYADFEDGLFQALLEKGVLDVPISITHFESISLGFGALDQGERPGLRIGIDTTSLARMQKLVGHHRLNKILAPSEIEEYNNDPAYLARIFAAKEAASKVLGTGLTNGTYLSTIVTHEEDGVMSVQLTDGALEHQQRLGLSHFHIRHAESRGAVAALVLAHK